MRVLVNAPYGVKFDELCAAVFAIYHDGITVTELRNKIVSNKLYMKVLGQLWSDLAELERAHNAGSLPILNFEILERSIILEFECQSLKSAIQRR